MDDGRGLCAELNVPSDYNIVNVARLEMVIWEQVLDSHSAFQFFMLFWSEKMLNLCFEMYTEISPE